MKWQYLNETNKNFIGLVKMSYNNPIDYWFIGKTIYDPVEDQTIYDFLKDFDESEYIFSSMKSIENIFYEFITSNKDLAILFRLIFC